MRARVRPIIIISSVLCLCFIILFQLQVYAADTADTLAVLQADVTTAMQSRLTSYSITYTGDTSTINSDIGTVVNNIYDADDYLHYSSKQYSCSYSIAGGAANLKFSFQYWDTAAQVDYVSSTVTQVLNQIITSGMNDYQKEKAIHDWIVLNVAYDTTLVQHSDYAALVSPNKTVCQGYALLTYKMLTEAGIETRIVEGMAGSEAHSWNLVHLDGVWYHLDCTWDDPVPDVKGRVDYDYYNLTDSQIKAVHSWTKTYPAANTSFDTTLADKIKSDSSNASIYQTISDDIGLQYLTADYTASNSTELAAKIQQAMQSQQPELKIRYTSGSTLKADLKSITSSIHNISSYQYIASDYVRTTATGDVLLDLQLTYSTPVSVTAVSVSQSTLSLKVGGTSTTLTPTIAPVNASNKGVVWSSSDTSVATVSTGGVVKPVGGGTATITATTGDGSFTATCAVTVTQAVAKVAIDHSSLTLKLGDSDVTLNATISPSTATVKDIKWTSSNTNIATVSADGVVHSVGSGTASIIATSAQDSSKTAKCAVTVPVKVKAVALSKTAITLKLGSGTASLSTVLTPSNAAVKTVTWSSSDTSIATVSTAGKVSAVAVGTATITATTTDGGITATCAVTVIQPATKVSLDHSTLSIKLSGSDVTLNATISPDNATIKDVKWTSSNIKVATVGADGTVHPVASGTAVITAASVQDSTKTAKCTVTVPVDVVSITLSKSSITLKLGSGTASQTLTSTIKPGNATVRTITWSSSDTSIATVSATGMVKPVGTGKATITATTTDGGLTATCDVTVTQPVTGITLDHSTISATVGDSDITLNATINPDNATVKDVTWSSGTPGVATVSADGIVHIISKGTTIITVKSTQDTSKSAKCTVSVSAAK